MGGERRGEGLGCSQKPEFMGGEGGGVDQDSKMVEIGIFCGTM